MTPQQIALVQTSFSSMQTNADAIGRQFYARLFAVDPALRGLFSDDIEAQSSKFVAMLGLIVTNLNQMYAIGPAVEALGRYHQQLQVPVSSYEPVRAALLWTLAHEYGAGWTPDLQAAWNAAYAALLRTMQISGKPY